MLGGGEQYLSAFALLLHANPFQIGLLSALPQLVGTAAQWLSVNALHRVRHRKPVILAGSLAQAALWIPLFALPLLLPRIGVWILIGCAVAYFMMGHLAIPAWTSLMTDLVHPDQRGTYFAQRARIMAVVNFVALALAGLLLTVARRSMAAWVGFALIFLLAAGARALSAYYVAKIDETATPGTSEAEWHLGRFLWQDRGRDFRWFLLFTGGMHFCVLVSGPFFVVYMLQDLHFAYWQYGAWLAAGTLGQFLSYGPWGRLGDQYGNKKLLVVTGLLVPFLPMLYLVSANVAFLLLVNFSGGIVWAGLSLALQNYVLDAVRPEDRAKGVAVFHTINSVGWFGGAMLGGWLATLLPATIGMGAWQLALASNLPVVFLVSGILRLLVSVSLLGTFHEHRQVAPISHRQFLTELPLIRPVAQTIISRGER